MGGSCGGIAILYYLMSNSTLLSRLKNLSDVDAALLRIISERKKLQADFDNLGKQIDSLTKEVARLKAKSAEDKKKYDLETRRVKSEKDGLAARRRALATLGNYKLQNAAAKEIDAAEKALADHEDSLLALLDGSEASEKLSTEKELLLLEKDEDKATLIEELKPALENLAFREKKYLEERAEIVVGIDPKTLAIYEGAKIKLAPDTLAAVKDGACDFCNLQVPPQMLILVNQAQVPQKCRGCSRILYSEAPQS